MKFAKELERECVPGEQQTIKTKKGNPFLRCIKANVSPNSIKNGGSSI